MAAEGGRIDFMFLAPPYPAAGSATALQPAILGGHFVLISLHIRNMWETICDAWACWSGWNFGPNSTVYPYSEEYLPPPPPPPTKIEI